MPLFVDESIENYKQEDIHENSVLGVLQKYGNEIPKLRFDCGTEDDLISYNRELHSELNTAEIKHVYEEFTGAHEWTYWGEHIKKSLLFFASS